MLKYKGSCRNSIRGGHVSTLLLATIVAVAFAGVCVCLYSPLALSSSLPELGELPKTDRDYSWRQAIDDEYGFAPQYLVTILERAGEQIFSSDAGLP